MATEWDAIMKSKPERVGEVSLIQCPYCSGLIATSEDYWGLPTEMAFPPNEADCEAGEPSPETCQGYPQTPDGDMAS